MREKKEKRKEMRRGMYWGGNERTGRRKMGKKEKK
jgi:hypothetical protein